jgi:hypothetical protein
MGPLGPSSTAKPKRAKAGIISGSIIGRKYCEISRFQGRTPMITLCAKVQKRPSRTLNLGTTFGFGMLYCLNVKSLVGSFIVMFVGAFSILGGLLDPHPASDVVMGGTTMILGALAYRSAKRRRLGLKTDSKLRHGVEGFLLVLVCVPVVILASKGPSVVADNPISGIFVPLCSLAAYLWICKRRATLSETEPPSIR